MAPDKEWGELPIHAFANQEKSPGSLSLRTGTLRRITFYLAVIALIITCLALQYLPIFDLDAPATRTAGQGGSDLQDWPNRKTVEELFLSVPSAESALAASRQYASEPHMAGTPGDLKTAKMFLSLLQEQLGAANPDFEPMYSAGTPQSRNATLFIPQQDLPAAWIDIYYPVMNTALECRLEILDDDGQVAWEADLEEHADETDPDAHQYAHSVPPFLGLSRGGEVSGKLVYANYGLPDDFQELQRKGISLNNTIALVRYGALYRGLKIMAAQEVGCTGILIYSDPRDDGVATTENGYLPYPEGPARNPTSIERGSVQLVSIYPGDPTTPGYPAYENSTRSEGLNRPAIPSLPLSWANAQVLLREIGPNGRNRSVRLVNNVKDQVTPIWNVMGVIPGHIRDEVLIVGSHRDAWVLGAADPSSGTASLHEVIRGFGELLRHGWKPLRTIMIASWDAEEFGMIGSTEWGEDFLEWIDEYVVAYLNLDASVYGSQYRVHGSPSLSHIIRSTAERIAHPTDPNRTLWDAKMDTGTLEARYPIEGKLSPQSNETDSLGVVPLGSGSDFTVFLQRIGVASSNEDFIPGPNDPVYHYHSVFDSQRWQEVYGDPGFKRHVAVAKHLGLQTLSFADSAILPLNTTHYAFELGDYLTKVERLASQMSLPVDLEGLRNAIHRLQFISRKLDQEKRESRQNFERVARQACGSTEQRKGIVADNDCKCLFGRMKSNTSEELAMAFRRIRIVNKKLSRFERGLIHKDGLFGRTWYRHLGVAPGKWSGTGATTFPALTEALTLHHNVSMAQYEARRLQDLIIKLTESIRP